MMFMGLTTLGFMGRQYFEQLIRLHNFDPYESLLRREAPMRVGRVSSKRGTKLPPTSNITRTNKRTEL
jgi:hypothetical protein